MRDNGISISPQHHSRIFRVFKRQHGAEIAARSWSAMAAASGWSPSPATVPVFFTIPVRSQARAAPPGCMSGAGQTSETAALANAEAPTGPPIHGRLPLQSFATVR